MRDDFCLGEWIVRPRRGCIERGEELVHVHPKPMAVLECLADANGEVVTRDELHETVWADVIVSDEALTQCVAELRKAFGDSAKNSQVIKTIPKAGFCLVLPVTPLIDREATQAIRTKKWLLGSIAIITLLSVIAIWRMTETKDVEPPVTEPQQPSLAVLPLINRSSIPDDAFFVDGIHDDLLTQVSKISGIRTISRTSVMRYRDSTKSIMEIARELGVDTVLEGGVQRDGNFVRINVQLIDAVNDAHLWSENYDRELTAGNIFAIQSEISSAISVALKAALTPSERKRLRTIPTESLEAYEAFQMGRHHFAKREVDSLADAVTYFSSAVEIDPQYALAWASLGETYLVQREGASASDRKLLEKAQVATEKALALDPELGEAYTALGMLKWNQDDFSGSEKAYQKAIELAPNYATTYHWYSISLRARGHYEQAREMIITAAQLDPMSPVIRQNLANYYRTDGRYQDALEELEKAVTIDPNFARAYAAMATIEYQVFNRMSRAVQGYGKVINLNPASHVNYTWLGQLYLDLEEPERASLLFDRARDLMPDGIGAHWGGLLMQVYDDDLDNISGHTSSLVQFWGPGRWITQFAAAQLRNQALARNQYSQALRVYSTSYPELLDDPNVSIGLNNYRAAIDLSLVLQKLGKHKQADHMLNRCREFIRERPRLGWWGGYWISDVLILALQGKKTLALSALQDAVDENWRSLWWYYLRYDPNLESIRNEPEFQQVLALIEADMSSQMQDIRKMEINGDIAAVPGVDFGTD